MRVVLGVGGGIAAYKSAELVRTLQGRGHQVQVVLTAAAREFVQPLTFSALSGQKVITDLFSQSDPEQTLSSAVEHIAVAQEHDILLVAPATANLLGKFANGLADDFLSTLYLAFTGKVILAPAMNTVMWNHPATQANVNLLKERGCSAIDPEEGWLACGTMGAGRLPDPVRIADYLDSLVNQKPAGKQMPGKKDLDGENILITAGPTQEPLDPVRYISNRSSGKMGYAIAKAAARRGASVTLVSGPVQLPPPPGMQVIYVRTAKEMHDAVVSRIADASIIIKSAAVADYQLSEVPQQKMKKTAARLSLQLDPTPDILAEIGRVKGDRLLVGFAAETQNLLEEGRRKMVAKNCDMVVANLVNADGLGFESDTNEVEIMTRSGDVVHAGPADKAQIAESILDQVAVLRLSVYSLDAPA